MPNSKDVFSEVVKKINLDENQEEINSIVYLLLQSKFGIRKSDIVGNKEIEEIDKPLLDKLILRLNQNEPLQYILEEQEFYGRTFKVNPSVLIPRPETELLVNEVISICHTNDILNPKILDIGSGSGCIPITLSLEIADAKTIGIDISKDAIEIASYNASRYNAHSKFTLCDIFKDEFPQIQFDIIVSNPPYVTDSEKTNMKANVANYEPAQALFVPDENPLLFYKEIIKKTLAEQSGRIWIVFEINERFGNEITSILNSNGFEKIRVLKDLSDKNRIVSTYYNG